MSPHFAVLGIFFLFLMVVAAHSDHTWKHGGVNASVVTLSQWETKSQGINAPTPSHQRELSEVPSIQLLQGAPAGSLLVGHSAKNSIMPAPAPSAMELPW